MPAALADILPETDGYRNLVSQVRAGDAVYLLATSGQKAQLLCWKDGMTQAEIVADGLINASFYSTTETIVLDMQDADAAQQADAMHALSVLFSDGEQLYGYNSLEKLVFAIDVTTEGVVCTDVATLPAVMNTASSLPIRVVKTGDWMLWFETDMQSRNYAERLLAFNLKEGTVKQAVLPQMCDIAPYKDGKILVLCQTEESQDNPYAVYAYQPERDKAECIGTLPTGASVRKIAYSPELDMIVYQDHTRIMGMTANGETEQIGFIPTNVYAELLPLSDQLLYSTDAAAVDAVEVRKGYASEHSLTLMGSTMYNVLSQFYMRFMDVPVYHTDRMEGESYTDALSREEEMPDLVYLYANTGEYTELLESGCLMDLSQYEGIMAYINLLYPAYQELVQKDGGTYGVPVYADSYNGWYINKSVMNAMGLTAEDIPTSLTELCAFATKWNDEYAEKYPHYTLLNETEHYRERMLEVILECWADYCQYNDQALMLDNPVFRELLAAFEAMHVDKLDAALRQTNPEVSEYKQALIWTGCKDVGNWACYMEEISDRIFIPLTLTPDTSYIAAVENVGLWVVNNQSENGQYAAALLEEALAKQSNTHAYVLRTDKTEPVLDDYYAEIYASEAEKLAWLESRLEDSVNRATIEKRIEEQKQYMNGELLRYRYDIFPSAIEQYRNVIAPASFVSMANALDADRQTEKMALCIDDYLEGQMTAEEFIAAMESMLQASK